MYDKYGHSHLPLSHVGVEGVIMADQKQELLRKLKRQETQRLPLQFAGRRKQSCRFADEQRCPEANRFE